MRNLGKPVELAGQYYSDGADEVDFGFAVLKMINIILLNSCNMFAFQVTFLNITGFRDFPLGDLPMLQVCVIFLLIVFCSLSVSATTYYKF